MNSETIAMIANISLALSLIVAVILGIFEVKSAKRDRKERLTIETVRNVQTREFAELIQYINTNNMPQTAKEFRERPAAEQVIYIQYGQEMESLGLMVAEKYIDLDLIDKTLGGFVTTTWEKYKPLFSDMREKTPDPFLGEYFQWLAEQIDKRMKETPRIPFHQQS